MRIITLTCPKCGTVVAGNVLEDRRVMKCPGLNCEYVLRFEELSENDQTHLVENRQKYIID
jgi:hypothetical protein